MSDFDLDEHGEIITKPVGGWTLSSIGGVAILLRVEHFDSEADLESGTKKALQYVLTAKQASELAEMLIKQVKRLYNANLPPGAQPN